MTFVPVDTRNGTVDGDVSMTLQGGRRPGGWDANSIPHVTGFHMLQDPISADELAPAWGRGTPTGTASIAIQQDTSVRRLTPTECERLQGLPDGWTDLGGTPDSKRYAALGDAVTVNVAEWIGRRLLA